MESNNSDNVNNNVDNNNDNNIVETTYSELDNISYSTTWETDFKPIKTDDDNNNSSSVANNTYQHFPIQYEHNYKGYHSEFVNHSGFCDDNFLLPSPYVYPPFNSISYPGSLNGSYDGSILPSSILPISNRYENSLASFSESSLTIPQFRKKHGNGTYRQNQSQVQKELPALHVKSTGKKCSNCLCEETPSWRRDQNGINLLCNACGLYEKLHSQPRPIYIDKDGFIKVVRDRKNRKTELKPQASNFFS